MKSVERRAEDDEQLKPVFFVFDADGTTQSIRVSAEVLWGAAEIVSLIAGSSCLREQREEGEEGNEKVTFVPLCMTISAPHLNGSCSGGGAKVESTARVAPIALAFFESASETKVQSVLT